MRHRCPDIPSAVMITMDSLAKRRVKYTANAEIPRIITSWRGCSASQPARSACHFAGGIIYAARPGVFSTRHHGFISLHTKWHVGPYKLHHCLRSGTCKLPQAPDYILYSPSSWSVSTHDSKIICMYCAVSRQYDCDYIAKPNYRRSPHSVRCVRATRATHRQLKARTRRTPAQLFFPSITSRFMVSLNYTECEI